MSRECQNSHHTHTYNRQNHYQTYNRPNHYQRQNWNQRLPHGHPRKESWKPQRSNTSANQEKPPKETSGQVNPTAKWSQNVSANLLNISASIPQEAYMRLNDLECMFTNHPQQQKTRGRAAENTSENTSENDWSSGEECPTPEAMDDEPVASEQPEGTEGAQPTKDEEKYLHDYPLHRSARHIRYLRDSNERLWEKFIRQGQSHTRIIGRTGKPITMYHHANKSWTSCYDDNCLIHLTEKEGAGYFPKREKNSQYPRTDDRNFMHKETSWHDCLDPYCTTHLDKKEAELAFTRPANYETTLQQRQVEKELASNPKEYDPLWTQVFDEDATKDEGTPVLTWQQVEWEELEDYQTFKDGMVNWLKVNWEDILEDEDAFKAITNWKIRYAHDYKKQKLNDILGPWTKRHLPPPKLEDDGWDNEMFKAIYENDSDEDSKNMDAPRN